ncbi:MAG TPA: hypothetical protein VMB27_18080 [Solirubrobacteraceae bacterium]|nr:hypothetical protein [Solirubrobacteraceae bacterium]
MDTGLRLSIFRPRPGRASSTARIQSLTITLNGITAGDYLAWVRDPEPPALDYALQSVGTRAEPLGAEIRIDLAWACRPPTTPRAAAVAAGFPLTPEVVAVKQQRNEVNDGSAVCLACRR